MSPLVSVVTLTHNKLAYTRRCLSSWLETTGAAWELIVVDNGSTDGTREWLDGFRGEAGGRGVPVRLVLNPGNIGCSTARNQGVALARGEHVVFADNDVALRSRRWLAILAGRLAERPEAGMAGPKIVYPFPPHDIQFAGGGVTRSGRVCFCGRGERRDDPRFTAGRDVQCFISACCMIRRSVFEEIGGLDEAFNPVEFEDIDFSYRLRARGYRIAYVPEAEMYHFESVTTAGTASIPNTSLIVRHGLLFKERWRHMFERESGPAESEARWRRVERRPLESVGELPVID